MPDSISTKEYDHVGLRFNDLYEEGIRLIQKYSGDIWTDYNYHDPGVTILEHLIYALMDLTYRTNMPVEDLFFIGVDDFDSVRNNLLFPPEDIFHCDPHTTADYRKMIIDRVRLVKNAWVNPVRDDSYGYKGLYEVLIQSGEELDDEEKATLSREVSALFHKHRNLGSDLGRLTLLEAVPLAITGKINIDIDAIGEYVMARIFAELDEYINPEVMFQNPYDLIQSGMPIDQVFSGPRPVHGHILDQHLKPKSDTVFVSRIRDIIMRVPGVKSIVELQVLRKGLVVKDDQINFAAGSYPVIEYVGISASESQKLSLMRNNLEIVVDPVTTQQLLDFEMASRRNNYLGRIQYRNRLPKGRFKPEEIERHFSIHNDFPAIYGLGIRNQIAKSDTDERRGQAKQLRAYLAFFEQIIANHLSQLTNMRKLLSIDQAEGATYFTQLPTDIPFFQDLLNEDPAAYGEFLREISNEKGNYYLRLNRILDHLMARFSEHIDKETLRKHTQQNPVTGTDMVDEEIVRTKIRFLSNIVQLSTSRNTAFDYRKTGTWETENISILEKKLALSLNMRHITRRSLVRPLLEWFGMRKTNSEEEPVWQEESWENEEGERFSILRLPSSAYGNDQLKFPRMGISFISFLFSQGISPRFLRILHLPEGEHTRSLLLLKTPDMAQEILIHEHEDAGACEEVMNRLRMKVNEIDRECEGFHMLEHILLRPLEPIFFTFNILDARGAIFMTGYFPGTLEQQNVIADEIPLLGSHPENFSILSEDENMTFRVVLYDSNQQPVASLKKTFNSRVVAEKSLSEAAAYLSRILAREVELTQVLEITNTRNIRVEIPEEFVFSNAVSFILPSWPSRFQNEEFITLFRGLVSENIPAHFTAEVYLLDPEKLSAFEDLFGKWLQMKTKDMDDYSELDMLSVQIIQMLTRLRKING